MGRIASVIFVVVLVMCGMAVAGTDPMLSGTVKSVQTAGRYVYLQLDQEGKEVWVATTALPVKSGDQVEYAPGEKMVDFKSPALGRTFEAVYFVAHLRVVGGAATDSEGLVPNDATHRSALAGPSVQPASQSDAVPQLEGGTTIAAIYRDGAQLNGQSVRLRARVTKVNRQIMGKNWVTLDDGTGAAPDTTLVATTQENVAAGEVVVVQGVVRANVDLGAGYVYKLLVEQATFSR